MAATSDTAAEQIQLVTSTLPAFNHTLKDSAFPLVSQVSAPLSVPALTYILIKVTVINLPIGSPSLKHSHPRQTFSAHSVAYSWKVLCHSQFPHWHLQDVPLLLTFCPHISVVHCLHTITKRSTELPLVFYKKKEKKIILMFYFNSYCLFYIYHILAYPGASRYGAGVCWYSRSSERHTWLKSQVIYYFSHRDS